MAKVTSFNIGELKVRNQGLVEGMIAKKQLGVVLWLSNGSQANEAGIRAQVAVIKNGKFEQIDRSTAGKISQYLFGADSEQSGNAGVQTRLQADGVDTRDFEVQLYKLEDEKLIAVGEADINFTAEGAELAVNGGVQLTDGTNFNLNKVREEEREQKKREIQKRVDELRKQGAEKGKEQPTTTPTPTRNGAFA